MNSKKYLHQLYITIVLEEAYRVKNYNIKFAPNNTLAVDLFLLLPIYCLIIIFECIEISLLNGTNKFMFILIISLSSFICVIDNYIPNGLYSFITVFDSMVFIWNETNLFGGDLSWVTYSIENKDRK